MNTIWPEFLACITAAFITYGGAKLAVRLPVAREWIIAHRRILNPNKISVVGAVMGVLGGTILYFVLHYHRLGLLFFMVSWALDGVDGIIARGCCLGSELGQELDPLMDKVRYFCILPFIWADWNLSVNLLMWLFAVDFLGGQFIVRYIVKKHPDRFRSVAANWLGKTKTTLINLFILSFYYFDLGGGLLYPQILRDYSRLCPYIIITLALASAISKMVPKTKSS